MFCGCGSYIKEKSNAFDALIVDETYRITEKTSFLKRGDNQIKEIIKAVRFSIFFIDSKQRIHIDDYGTIDRIKFFANELSEIFIMENLMRNLDVKELINLLIGLRLFCNTKIQI